MILVLNFITGDFPDITEVNGVSVDYLHYETVILHRFR